jgi:hypothetical protein
LREAIVNAFARGFDRVVFDGKSVSIERRASEGPSHEHAETLAAIHAASSALEDHVPSRLGDPFLWKALIAEGVAWGIAGYAIGAFVELVAHDEDYYPHTGKLLLYGLIVALAVFVFLLVLITRLMRGSSRSHRVLLECAVVLAVSLPFAGTQLVSETNRTLDDAEPRTTARKITLAEMRKQGSRRSRSYSYYLRLGEKSEPTDPDLPEELEISRVLYNAASTDKTIEIEIGPGRWGIEWYRRLQVGRATWTPPE